MTATQTITQTDDQTSLRDVYPMQDVDSLTDEQQDALAEATRQAMRPLVEAEWTTRGYEVKWTSDQFNHTRLTDEQRDAEVTVWGHAYEQLDDAAAWAAAGLADAYRS